jgi:hypothetical protein
MNKFEVSLARESDDLQIRRLLHDNPVPGKISLIYQKEPSYFQASSIANRQTISIVIKNNNKIVAVLTIGIRDVYLNGKIQRVGYLNNLRLDKKYQGQKILKVGFDFLKKMHPEMDVPFYYSTIIADNKKVLNILSQSRERGLQFVDYGNYYTKAIILNQKKKTINKSYHVIRGSEDNLAEIVNFLNQEGKKKDFFYNYKIEDFKNNFLRDFDIKDFFVALEGDKVIAVMGLWDQNNFKQNVVTSYNGLFKLYKLYNFVSPVFSLPRLPDVGQKLNFAYLSFVVIRDNNPDIFAGLLKAVYNNAINKDYLYLVLGFHEKDKLLSVLDNFSCITYKSKLFMNYWQTPDILKDFELGVPYIELATL